MGGRSGSQAVPQTNRFPHTVAAPRWRGICPGGTVAKLCERISVKLLDTTAVCDTVSLASPIHTSPASAVEYRRDSRTTE